MELNYIESYNVIKQLLVKWTPLLIFISTAFFGDLATIRRRSFPLLTDQLRQREHLRY